MWWAVGVLFIVFLFSFPMTRVFGVSYVLLNLCPLISLSADVYIELLVAGPATWTRTYSHIFSFAQSTELLFETLTAALLLAVVQLSEGKVADSIASFSSTYKLISAPSSISPCLAASVTTATEGPAGCAGGSLCSPSCHSYSSWATLTEWHHCCPSPWFTSAHFSSSSTSGAALSIYLFSQVSQEEVLLSPFLSPRPGNGFPSCRYYANRLQPQSCVEVSVIMALLALCSSPPSTSPSLCEPIFSSTFLILFSNPPTTRLLWMSSHPSTISHTFIFSSTLLLFLHWGCCSREARL